MAAHLTLEEAAEVLGISADDFKKRLKTDPMFKNLDRGKIRDGSSFRFKDSAVDELARELGAGSDPGKNTRTVGSPATPAKGTPKIKHEEPLNLSNDDDDVFSLSNDDPVASGPKTSKFKRSETIPTEEIAIDFSGPASGVHKEGGSSAKHSAPRSSTKLSSEGSSKNLAKKPPKPPSDDSEFELSLDGGDDAFELKLGGGAGIGDDEDDAIDLGELPKDTPGGSRVGRGGESGILSRKPNDTGRSLERKDPKGKNPKSGSLPPLPTGAGAGNDAESDVDFELTLDAGAGVSSSRLGITGPKSKKKLATDSDSEFELTLDDSSAGGHEAPVLDDSESEGSKGDIFETDFEIPPMDPSGSEAVVMDSTDTDVESIDEEETEEDSSASEVVLLEDEDEAPKPKGGRSSSKLFGDDDGDVDLADVDLDVDEESAAGALRGVRDTGADEEEEEEAVMVGAGAGAYRPVPWGFVPLLFLLPAFLLTLVGGLMGFELLQTMWGYQQPRKPAAPLVRSIASQFDMELKD